MADFKVEFASNDANFDAKFGEVQTVNTGAAVKSVLYIKQELTDEQQAQARENIGVDAEQIAQNKTDIERLNADKLDADKLPEAINDALAQAKESGEFDGKDGKDGSNGRDGVDGYTPQKGKDYYTEADKAEMVSAVIAALPVYDGEVVAE